jgi:hypothetical protein
MSAAEAVKASDPTVVPLLKFVSSEQFCSDSARSMVALYRRDAAILRGDEWRVSCMIPIAIGVMRLIA